MQKTGNCQQHPQPVAASEKLEEHFLLLQRQLTLDNLQQSQNEVLYVDAIDTEHIILSTATTVTPQLACQCVHDTPDQAAFVATLPHCDLPTFLCAGTNMHKHHDHL